MIVGYIKVPLWLRIQDRWYRLTHPREWNWIQKKLKPLTLVKFNLGEEGEGYYGQYPFKKDETVVFLGEIRKMPGHCIVANREGQVHWGYHTENFIELTEDEI